MAHIIKKQRIDGALYGNTFLYTWGAKGVAEGQFTSPVGIAVGTDNRVYVADGHNHRIQCFDSKGTFIRMWGREGSGDGEFGFPVALSVNVCTRMQESIWNEMKIVPALAKFPPGVLPICVAYIGDERIAVCDSVHCRIQLFRTDGQFICKWGSRGNLDGHLDGPLACSMTKSETLYVVEDNNHRIQCFKSDGTFVRKWGKYGSGNTEFKCPSSISIDQREEMLYITDYYNDRILTYRPDGTFQGVLRLSSNVLRRPTGIVVDEGDENAVQNMFVCYPSHPYVAQYRMEADKTATFIRAWGDRGTGDSNFDKPVSIAKGMNGLLYVTDVRNNRIVAIKTLA